MNTALETRGLSCQYGRNWALRDCDLSVAAGSITGLVGPNGAGKSTLLRIAAGLTTPASGSVEVFGEQVVPGSNFSRTKIGYLDQRRPLYEKFRVSEMLEFGNRLNPHWDGLAADEWIREWNIPLDRRVDTLSVGQQAQVALAIALAKRPDLLLLDEPVASLDPVARSQLLQVLLAIVADRGVTVVISSHLIAELEPICDDIILMTAGQVSLHGSIAAILDDHRLLIGPDKEEALIGREIVSFRATGRQLTVLTRGRPTSIDAEWDVLAPSLEEIVLGYLLPSPIRTSGTSFGSPFDVERIR